MDTHLKFSEQTSEQLWDNAMWGLALCNADGGFIKVNPTLCNLLEYTESELLARTFQDITHPDDLYDDVHMSEEVHRGHVPYYIMTKRYITKTDGVLWAKLRVDRVQQEDGSFCHFLSQISPAVKLSKQQVLEAQLNGVVSKKKKDTGVKAYVLRNLKWIIPLVLTGVGSTYKVYHEFQSMKEAIAQQISQEEPQEKASRP